MEDPPYRLTWTLAHRTGEAPLSSQFVSLIEAGEAGRPVVREWREIPASGGGTLPPVVLRAETRVGSDLIVVPSEPGRVTPESGDWSFEGEYGFARTGTDGVRQVSLTGGGRFVVEGVGFARTAGCLSGRVVGGDFRSREVILSGIEASPGALVGRHVRIQSEDRCSTYRVAAAEAAPQGIRLLLDVDIRIGEGTADEFEDGAIVSRVHFPLAGYRYDHGARLRSSRGETFLLDHVEPGSVADIESGLQPRSRFVLAPVAGKAIPAERLRAALGESGAFTLYDLGAGDSATFTLTSWIRRTDARTLEGDVGPATILALGKGLSGTARVSRGGREWMLPIRQDEGGTGILDLGEAGIGMGPVKVVLQIG
jgi:hypothetical protein